MTPGWFPGLFIDEGTVDMSFLDDESDEDWSWSDLIRGLGGDAAGWTGQARTSSQGKQTSGSKQGGTAQVVGRQRRKDRQRRQQFLAQERAQQRRATDRRAGANGDVGSQAV